jgi:hypothetical protein
MVGKLKAYNMVGLFGNLDQLLGATIYFISNRKLIRRV